MSELHSGKKLTCVLYLGCRSTGRSSCSPWAYWRREKTRVSAEAD